MTASRRPVSRAGVAEVDAPCTFAWSGAGLAGYRNIDGPILVCRVHGQKAPCDDDSEFDAYEHEWPWEFSTDITEGEK